MSFDNKKFEENLYAVSGHKNRKQIATEVIKKYAIVDDNDSYYKKLGRFFRGEQIPDIQTLTELADTFSCPIDYLLGRSDNIGNVDLSKINSLSDYTPHILRRIANDIIFFAAVAGIDLSILPEKIRRSMYEHNLNDKYNMVVDPEEANYLFMYFIMPVLNGYSNIININGISEETKMKSLNELIAGCIKDFMKTVNDTEKYKKWKSDLHYR